MPPTRMDTTVDDFFGTLVADPYRWLEDAVAPEVRAWTAEQNARTDAYLERTDGRAALRARLTQLWDYPRYGTPRRYGDRYFFAKNDGLQAQAVLYWQEGADGSPTVLLDPNTLSADGTISLGSQAFSRDGRFVCYGLSQSGSDWQELRVREVETASDGPEVLRHCRFASIGWAPDNSGFYYNRYPAPGSVPPEDAANFMAVYWHRLGTEQAADALVYDRPDDKEVGFSPFVTDDGRYLLLYVNRGTSPRNGVYWRRIDADGPFVRLQEVDEARLDPIDIVDGTLYAITDRDAPRGRLVAIDLAHPQPERWREVLAQGDAVLDFATMAGDVLVVAALRDAHHELARYSLTGAPLGEIALPTIGSVGALSGKWGDRELFLAFTSYLYPTTILRHDTAAGTTAPFFPPAGTFDPAPYETRQVFFHSKDGTRVPMFLTHRRDLPRGVRHPTLLYGYGGFNVSLTPGFAIGPLAWLERGGIYAVANLRGGGEYGEDWHQAGMLDRKQNVFDDFIAAAEHLLAEGYTSASQLAIQGGSNGGLLVAACLLQRPGLFGAAICQVPVTDMLRYQRFTVGRYWVPEYGDATADAKTFRYLRAYSPLHNVRPGRAYPPTFIHTADTDDRVAPLHAMKFAAALQAAQAGDSPILLRVETRAGHGAGKPTAKLIETQGELYAFLFRELGVE